MTAPSPPPATASAARREPVTHLLYLHGFRSSPQSVKARQVAERVAARHPGLVWLCPQLPPSPRAAMALIETASAGWPADRMGVIGSSLGGYYATALAERRGCRAVLLNPAVFPARDLARHIGEQTVWQNPQDRFFFRAEFVDELLALQQPLALAEPAGYFAIIARGDEVLDWREMAARYHGARIKLLEGGDHALSDFDRHTDDIFSFLGLT